MTTRIFLNAVSDFLDEEYKKARLEFITADNKCKALERLLGMCADEMNKVTNNKEGIDESTK